MDVNVYVNHIWQRAVDAEVKQHKVTLRETMNPFPKSRVYESFQTEKKLKGIIHAQFEFNAPKSRGRDEKQKL